MTVVAMKNDPIEGWRGPGDEKERSSQGGDESG